MKGKLITFSPTMSWTEMDQEYDHVVLVQCAAIIDNFVDCQADDRLFHIVSDFIRHSLGFQHSVDYVFDQSLMLDDLKVFDPYTKIMKRNIALRLNGDEKYTMFKIKYQ